MSNKKGSNIIEKVLNIIKNMLYEMKKTSKDIGEKLGNLSEDSDQDELILKRKRANLQVELNKFLAIKEYTDEIKKEIEEYLEPSLKELKSKKKEGGRNPDKDMLFILYEFKAKMLAKVAVCVYLDNKSSDEDKKSINEKIKQDLKILGEKVGEESKDEILASYNNALREYLKVKNNINNSVNVLPAVTAEDAYNYYNAMMDNYITNSNIEIDEL